MRRLPVLAGIALVLAAGLAQPVAAQRARLSVSAVAGSAGSALALGGSGEDGSGVWIGGRVDLQLGPFVAEAMGVKGTLAPGSGGTFERDGGEMRAVAGIELLRVLALEGSYTMRAFDSPAGYQEWTMTGGGVRLSSALGTPGVTGFLRVHYLASVEATGAGTADQALAVEAGFEIAPRSSPFTLGAFYRLERFDFTSGGTTRAEHFDMLGVRVGFQLLR